ncbi:MAG TPA: wax ester/triacylglycerol synthase family O-acyltransferase [Candidatus Acidoferrales bacterium]|nr:wax ester/triacylglycerol synthase family O-acyltransferase [Candidatus Acidoferrales bacterium]
MDPHAAELNASHRPILVVDDDPVVRESMQGLLELEGHRGATTRGVGRVRTGRRTVGAAREGVTMGRIGNRRKHPPRGVVYEDWMGESDALMWHIERDPLLRSTVLGVWLLDRAPDSQRFAATLERTLHHVPRLRQRVVEDPVGVAPPRWESDPFFDLSYHIRHVRVPGTGTLRELLDMAAPVAVQGFDRDRPLWELHCVEGLDDGRFGMILKMHHAMTDGVGMVRMTEGLVERSRDDGHAGSRARPARAGATRSRVSAGTWPQESPGEIAHLGEAMRHRLETALGRTRRAVAAFGRGVTQFAGHPITSAGEVVDTLGSVAQLVRPVSEPLSPLWRRRSLGVRLDVLDVPFNEMKRTAHAVGGTLNDVFVTAVAGGLSRYHRARRATVAALRMSMPINIRGDDAKGAVAGNQFVPARFPVPMDIGDPRERLRTVGALVRGQRDEPALGWTEEITAAINLLGETAATRVVGSMMKAVDFVTSNVPGPPFPVFMSGARIERMFPFGPPAGAAVNITLFSYNGVALIGIRSDPVAVPDPDRLVAALRAGFDEVLAIV